MKRAGDLLSVLFDERLMRKAQGYSKLFASWADITKKNGIAAAADHSRIRELDRGLIQIEADHPGWIQILQTKESTLLDDFRRCFPNLEISGISLRLSRGGPRLGDAGTGEQKPEAVTEDAKEPAGTNNEAARQNQTENRGYDTIKNGAFRETLQRLEQSIAEKESALGNRNKK
jgi:hypothetical protein